MLENINISVNEQEVVVILGPNGHGKSTLLKSICGLAEKTYGEINFKGENIINCSTEKIVNMGITYIAETRELFPEMSVLENLKLGAYSKHARLFEKQNLSSKQ